MKLLWILVNNSFVIHFYRHAGLVSLCGRAIHRFLYPETDPKMRVLSFDTWQKFTVTKLQDVIMEYPTFSKMVNTLTKEKHRDALDLLRSYFLGEFDEFLRVNHPDQHRLAAFLAAEGALQSDPLNKGINFKISSPLVDMLIRQLVIPKAYPNAPSIPIPNRTDGSLDTWRVLKECFQFFDKDLLRIATALSYKSSEVHVRGRTKLQVPRESVYNTELTRLLTNWVGMQKQYTISGQYHLIDPTKTGNEKHKYCNVVIKKKDKPTILLELLASGNEDTIQAHIDKTPRYKSLASADEAWIVHYTCEDGYLDGVKPYWDEKAIMQGINMVHFWHDLEFTTARMSAFWKDENGMLQKDFQQWTI